jgi:hypothetical protein
MAYSCGCGEYLKQRGVTSLIHVTSGNALRFQCVQRLRCGALFAVDGWKRRSSSGPIAARMLGVGIGYLQYFWSKAPRVRLQTKVSIKEFQPDVETYTREYALVSGEPFLRMRTTGAAQEDYSVITSFPLSESDLVDRIVHGTPCHWTSVQPLPAWDPPIFRATHRFLLPQAGSTVLAAIYHQDVPAWSFTGTNDAVLGQGVLIGCLLRNTPGPCYVEGTDPDPHMLNYALRIPKGLGDPTTGQPLSEALNYTMPAVASLINPPAFDLNSDAMLLESGFLASIALPGVILAAKPGEVAPGTLVLRLYHAERGQRNRLNGTKLSWDNFQRV